MVTALQPQTTECVVKISSPVEIQHENESKPASSATSSMEVATDSKVITALEIGGAKSEPKLDLLRSDIDVEDVSEEAGSASSGEIVSSAPSSPTEKSCEDEKFSLERHSDASSRDRWRDLSSSDLRSQRYPPSPPSHHRVIPRAYSYRKRRSSPMEVVGSKTRGDVGTISGAGAHHVRLHHCAGENARLSVQKTLFISRGGLGKVEEKTTLYSVT